MSSFGRLRYKRSGALFFLIGLLLSCEGDADPFRFLNTKVRSPRSASEVIKKVRGSSKEFRPYIISFLGYSGAGYDDQIQLDCHIREILEASRCLQRKCKILLGSTDGISMAATVGKSMGIQTEMVLSVIGMDSAQDILSRETIHRLHFVNDHTWGGIGEVKKKYHKSIRRSSSAERRLKLKALEDLATVYPAISETSKTLIVPADLVVMMGGGPIGVQELDIAQLFGTPVVYVPARFNERKYLEIFKMSGKEAPPILHPVDHFGAAYKHLEDTKFSNVVLADDFYKHLFFDDHCIGTQDAEVYNKIRLNTANPEKVSFPGLL